MPESFDIFQYAGHLRRRWSLIALACAVALVLSLSVSFSLPKKYTAASRIIIEPPAGSNLQGATAVSSIYLESLKTYELFASNDNLFLQATGHFGLRDQQYPTPIDRLKRSVLQVKVLPNTKILEISCTLRDAKKSQALAQYIAEATVDLNRKVALEGDKELAANAEKHLVDARASLRDAQAAWAKVAEQDGLKMELESLGTLQAKLLDDLSSAELNIAENADREKALAANPERAGELSAARTELRSDRVRIDQLRAQLDRLKRQVGEKQALLADRTTRRDVVAGQLSAARAAFEATEARLREVRSTAGYRGERLKIIDPGIVPERPSSPNIPLNVIGALLIAGVGSLLYATIEFSYRKKPAAPLRSSLRVANQGRDD